MENTIKGKINRRHNILDELVTTKIKDKLKKITRNDSYLAMYFVHKIRHFGIDSYLLTQTETINAVGSFTHYFFGKEKVTNIIHKNHILTDDEISKIINYALTLSEVNELLNEVSIFIETDKKDLDAHKKLQKIIGFFNTCNLSELYEKTNAKPVQFKLLLKIALLSIPQLKASSKYSAFSSGEFYISGKDKYSKCENLFDDFIKKKLELPDRLLLLVTIIEGYLWVINIEDNPDSGGLYDFCIGDLYDILSSSIKQHKLNLNKFKKTELSDSEKKNIENLLYDFNNMQQDVSYNVKTHSFYLQQFRFYIYGDIDDNLKDNNGEKLKELLSEIFASNLSDLILFAKSVIAKYNTDNVKTWSELSDTLAPKSIAHGLLSISLPKTIGIFDLIETGDESSKKGEFNLIDDNSFFKKGNNESINELDSLNNPWALYKVDKRTTIDLRLEAKNLTELKEGGFFTTEKYLVIRTLNALEKPLYIILEIDDAKDKDEVLENFNYYKYVFKSFVEKLQLINRSSSLNINPSSWYRKAFCNLYKDYDKIRFKEQYENEFKETHKDDDFRKWELDEIKKVLDGKSEIIIYDIGACCGRLEEKIINNGTLIDRIKKIYAIDQNQHYLQEIDNLNCPKIQTQRWDFKDISLIDDQKADLICFTHTVFGYFNDDAENELVLIKAFEMLKEGGVIMIDQFNPKNAPKHCNESTIPAYEFLSEGSKYRCIKTSNHKTPKETGENYGLYYGNYVYFDISDKVNEKFVKFDTYSIKLYTKKWFKEALQHNGYSEGTHYCMCCNIPDDEQENKPTDKTTNVELDGGMTMLLTIRKLREKNEIVEHETDYIPEAPLIP